MKSPKKVVVALTTLLLSAAGQSLGVPLTASPSRPPPESWAPGKQMPPGLGTTVPGADPFHLVMHSRKVQKELGLTANQIHRIVRPDRMARSGMRELPSPRDPASAESGRKTRSAQLVRHMQKAKGVIAKVLTPEQIHRLQEITLQINGPCIILMDPRLTGSLQFTAEQKYRVKMLCGQMAERMRYISINQSGRDVADHCLALRAKRQRIQQLRQETDKKITDLFSDKQAALYVKLSGEPFTLDPKEGPPCPGQRKMVGKPGH